MENKSFIHLFINKVSIVIIAFIALILISVYVFFGRVHSVVLYPNSQEFQYGIFDDRGNEGHSEIIKSLVLDSVIAFEFQLNKGFLNPYVGLNIAPKGNSFINYFKNNCIEIDLSATGIENLGLYVSALPRHQKNQNPESLTFYHSLKVQNNQRIYRINIDELVVPDWALGFKDLHTKKNIKPNLHKVDYINITTAYPAKAGDKGKISFHSIQLVRDNKKLIISLITIFILIISLIYYFLLRKYRKAQLKSVITVAYKPVNIDNQSVNEPAYITFINTNFQNPELSLDMVSDQTSTGQRTIANAIHQSYGCNFKTYVNNIRINESKRLLKQTDLNIGEIAYKVGFNNQSHFNRVFKSIENVSPSAFREKP